MGNGGTRRVGEPTASGSLNQFGALFEIYLDAVNGGSAGRRDLTESVVSELRDRGVSKVLDCAAGTGFPSLDLARTRGGLRDVRVCDGSAVMIRELARQAQRRGMVISELRPDGVDGLVVNWADLGTVTTRYDCVLCRGNALAYADTWTGRTSVAPKARVTGYVARMADRVRPGGYLYLDAPRTLDPVDASHPLPIDGKRIRERVVRDRGRRHWTVDFERLGGPPIRFERYSSLLTIDRVAIILDELGFEETSPFRLPAERAGFGTIIARKPG